jgi:hypothetical protein
MRSVWLLGLLISAGCGPSYIVLEVQAELAIPAETDELHVVAHDADEVDVALLNIRAPLESSSTFPLDVVLQPSGDTPRSVLVFRVRALLAEHEVAAGESRVKWDGDDLALGVELISSP